MRVLIVEDEEKLAEMIRRGLAEDGHLVDVVHTGPQGLDTARTKEFDVIVLDIMLPGLSGYRVVRQLREEQVWTPVLMLTAKDGEYDEADAFDLGADDYLTKPFSFVVLVARLRALARRGGPPRQPALTVGDLVLDPGRRRVTIDGAEVDLTPREYGVLQVLMSRAGEVVTKAEILQDVWEDGSTGDVNVVEVYVSYLRRKIDQRAHRSRIETLRGIGYRMVAISG